MNRRIPLMILISLMCMSVFFACSDDSTDPDTKIPQVVITYPVDNSEIETGSIITISAEAIDNKDIDSVLFFINGTTHAVKYEEPFTVNWNTTGSLGAYSICAKAIDTSGNSALSEVVSVELVNATPIMFSNPYPLDNSLQVSTEANISWVCTNPDGFEMIYDVYFGESADPPKVSENQSETTYSPSTLQYQTTYYWKIVASDGIIETESPIWCFTTGDINDLIFVQGGQFQMGDRIGSGSADELPLHDVSLNSFYISKDEITHAEFIHFLNSTDIPADGYYGDIEIIDMNDEDCAIGYTDHFVFIGSYSANDINSPVAEVAWYGAAFYCNWLSESEELTPCYDFETWTCDFSANGYRLPTEAEWEYAARGGMYEDDNYVFSGSNRADLVAWYNDNSDNHSHEVGTRLSNQLGIFDMSGNVWEWCNDFYLENYYTTSPISNPLGPEDGVAHVIRGGSAFNTMTSCNVSERGSANPLYTGKGLGFRIARDGD